MSTHTHPMPAGIKVRPTRTGTENPLQYCVCFCLWCCCRDTVEVRASDETVS